MCVERSFDTSRFIAELEDDCRPFVTEFAKTLLFHNFIDKKVNPLTTEDHLQNRFFDESVSTFASRPLLSPAPVSLRAPRTTVAHSFPLRP